MNPTEITAAHVQSSSAGNFCPSENDREAIDILNESGDHVLEDEREDTLLTEGPTVTIVTTLEEPELSRPLSPKDSKFKKCLFCGHWKLLKDIVNMENMGRDRIITSHHCNIYDDVSVKFQTYPRLFFQNQQEQAAACLGIQERLQEHIKSYGKFGVAFCRTHFNADYFRKEPTRQILSHCEICEREVFRSLCDCVSSISAALELDELAGSGHTILSAFDRCKNASKKVYVCKKHIPLERPKTRPSYRFQCYYCEETRECKHLTRIYSKFKAAALEMFLDCAPELTEKLDSDDMIWLCKSHVDEFEEKCTPELKLTLSQISRARADLNGAKRGVRRKKQNDPQPSTSADMTPNLVSCVHCKSQVMECEALRIAIKRIAEHYETILELSPGSISKHVVFNSKTSVPVFLCKSHISSCGGKPSTGVSKSNFGGKRKFECVQGHEIPDKRSKEIADEGCDSDFTWYSDSEDEEIDVEEDEDADYSALQASCNTSQIPSYDASLTSKYAVPHSTHYGAFQTSNYIPLPTSTYSTYRTNVFNDPHATSYRTIYAANFRARSAIATGTGTISNRNMYKTGSDYNMLTGEPNSRYTGGPRLVYGIPHAADDGREGYTASLSSTNYSYARRPPSILKTYKDDRVDST